MTYEEEIKSLVCEMVCMVLTMRAYAVKKTITHENLCKFLAEDTEEFNRLLVILQEELGFTLCKPVKNADASPMARAEIDKLDIDTLRKLAYAFSSLHCGEGNCPMMNNGDGYECLQFLDWIRNQYLEDAKDYYKEKENFPFYECETEGCLFDYELWKIRKTRYAQQDGETQR